MSKRACSKQIAPPKKVDNQVLLGKSDRHSILGHFGWELVMDFHVPYIIRHQHTRFCAKRFFKIILLKYFPLIKNEVMHCIIIEAYNTTKAEVRLLNEINTEHCDKVFGEPFTDREQICKLTDLQEMVVYLKFVMERLQKPVKPITPDSKCGFFRIDNSEIVLPFVVLDHQVYVPTFYLEGNLHCFKYLLKNLCGWELAYLKFCFKVQEVQNFNFECQNCEVVAFNQVRNYFSPVSYFIYSWPNDVKVDRFLKI